MSRFPLLALVALLGCGESAPERPAPRPGDRSIVLITLDTTRADLIGAYGSPVPVTPSLDAWAARGALFENAYAPMPQTLPSHATVLTGLMPRTHGALENMYVLDERFPSLASAARRRGYDTGAFVGALAIEAATGVDQGFDVFDQPAGVWGNDRKGHPPQRPADQVTDAALAWAQQLSQDRPFLLWAHYYDPHGDENRSRDLGAAFAPPAEHRAAIDPQAVQALVDSRSHRIQAEAPLPALMEFWRGYLAELRFMDEQVGRLLDGLRDQGRLDNAVLVFVGDHGEGLFEHGEKAHGTHLWEELMRVPLFLVHPEGLGAGRRVQQRVLLQDIEPTVRHLAFGQTQRATGELLGLDLWPFVLEGAEPPARPVFLERPHYGRERIAWRGGGRLQYGEFVAVLDGTYKLLREPDGSVSLYDLAGDPDELQDIAEREPEQASRLRELVERWLAAHPTAPPGEGGSVSEDDPRFDTLRELGYVGEDR